MVHVDVGPGLVVTCGRLVEGEGSWEEILLTAATGYYYNSKALTDSLTVSGIPTFQPDLYISRIVQVNEGEATLKEVLLIQPSDPRFAPRFRLLKMPDDHVRGGPLERHLTVGTGQIEADRWIPFPVATVSSLLPVEMIFEAHIIYRRILQHDVRKLETRNQVFLFIKKSNGQNVAKFRSLRLDWRRN